MQTCAHKLMLRHDSTEWQGLLAQ